MENLFLWAIIIGLCLFFLAMFTTLIAILTKCSDKFKKSCYIFLGVNFAALGIAGLVMSVIEERSAPKLSDKDLFISFFKEFLEKTNPIDETYRPFGKALERGDLVTATQIGVNIENKILRDYAGCLNMRSPDLKNDNAEKSIKEGLELISAAYMYKINILKEYLKFSENPSSALLRIGEIKNNGELYQQRLWQGMARIVSAGAEIGVDPKEYNLEK